MRARHFLFGCVSAGLSLISSVAIAQKELSPKFEEYLEAPEYVAYRASAMNRQDIALPLPLCSDIKVEGRRSIEILQTPFFTLDSTVPNSGRWIDSILIDRCGTPTVRNFLVNIQGPIEFIPITPGFTIAGANLQVDVQKTMRPTAAARLNCDEKRVLVTDTAVLSRDDPWRENWLFAGCGKGTTLTIEFARNDKGGWGFILANPGP